MANTGAKLIFWESGSFMNNSIFDQFINLFLKSRGSAGGLLHSALPWLEFGALIISILLIAGIIYAALRSNWLTYKADDFFDAVSGPGILSKRRVLRGWKRIIKQINSNEPQKWKSAVLEADKILGEILRLSGYRGGNVHERLEQVTPEVLPNILDLRAAHRVRDAIVNEPDFALSHEEAVKLIHSYASAFRELDLID